MALVNKILSLKEWKEERKLFQRILEHALHRKDYSDFNERKKVLVPEDVREAYFGLFASSVDKKSIQHEHSRGGLFLGHKAAIPFYGRSENGANCVLTYLPQQMNLEISSYSFNQQKEGVGIAEIGLFSTEVDRSGNLKTNLRVGDDFKYYSGYNANHSISGVIETLQKSKIIPPISLEILESLKGWKDFHEPRETPRLPVIS